MYSCPYDLYVIYFCYFLLCFGRSAITYTIPHDFSLDLTCLQWHAPKRSKEESSGKLRKSMVTRTIIVE